MATRSSSSAAGAVGSAPSARRRRSSGVTARPHGLQVDGGYAEYMLVPNARHLISLGHLHPDRGPAGRCGVTPWRAVRRASAWLQPGTRVLLIGFGGLGAIRAAVPAPHPRPDRGGARAEPREAGAGRRDGCRPRPADGRRGAGRARPRWPCRRRLRLRRQRPEPRVRRPQRCSRWPRLARRRGRRPLRVQLPPHAVRGEPHHHRLGLAVRPARGGAPGQARPPQVACRADAAGRCRHRARPPGGGARQRPDRARPGAG